MAHSFGLSHVLEYLAHMNLKVAHVNREHEIVELAFHSDHGQWRMIVGVQQSGDVRKLLLIAPHISTVTNKKRLECLEALMAVNYRIALGKFGLDLEDGEVRLEETIPLASHTITFEQFQLAFSSILQTVSMYHGLIPRIIYGNLSVQDALQACEQEYYQKQQPQLIEPSPAEPSTPATRTERLSELDVNDVLAEVTRLFEERHD
ncbi:MAG TPA: YbjN domain-containing protein [Ktedonosporobacter sp.]|nr:YbjN domain-containing protein [Ktedonosporobacter sp.]